MDDDIPMHRKVGDVIRFSIGGRDRHGKVEEVRMAGKKYGAALIVSHGEYFIERGQEITQLNDHDRCTHCGEFFCKCRQQEETKQTKEQNTNMSKPVSFTDLAGYAHKQVIPCVEGKLTGLKEPGHYKSGINEGKPYQFGFLKDDSNREMRIKFDNEACIQPMSNKGKRIRVMAKAGSKGLSGVYMEVGEYQNKETRDIRCTATAIIEVLGAGGEKTATSQERPDNGGSSDAPEHASKPSASSSVRKATHPVTIRRIAFDCLRAFHVFMTAQKALAEKGYDVGDLSISDIKDMATSGRLALVKNEIIPHEAWSDFKFPGDNGQSVDRAPTKASEKDLAEMPDQEWDGENHGSRTAEPPPEKPKREPSKISWKDFVWPSTGKKLGDTPAADLLKYARWAATAELDDDETEAKMCVAMMAMCCADTRGWKSKAGVFISSLGMEEGFGESFNEDDIAAYIRDRFDLKVEDLGDEEAVQLMDDYDTTVREIIEKAAESSKAEKKPARKMSIPA